KGFLSIDDPGIAILSSGRRKVGNRRTCSRLANSDPEHVLPARTPWKPPLLLFGIAQDFNRTRRTVQGQLADKPCVKADAGHLFKEYGRVSDRCSRSPILFRNDKTQVSQPCQQITIL